MNKKYILLLILVMVLTSCGARKNNAYLQDMESGTGYIQAIKHKTVMSKNDRIHIVVTSKIPELALPFNQNTSAIQVTGDGEVRPATTAGQATTKPKGYLVDEKGNIDFPVLGPLQVEGLSLSEVRDLVKERIEAGEYIKNPTVTVEYLNFKFYVLGAVSSKGEHSVEQSRLTLLEALSIAGDLAPNGRPDRVAVIRENDGSQIVYMHDLRSRELFESPAYYLKQNDIIYVEPQKETFKERTKDNVGLLTSLLSVVGTVSSVFLIIRTLK